MLRLFDTRTRTKQAFTPREEGKVGLYVCGPTVYDLSHLGHARVYVVFDTIVRYLRYRGYAVTHVRNYTDVDDKIIARAAERGVEPQELAQEFITAFVEDMDALGVEPADIEPRVTGHVPEIVDTIGRIIAAGYAYERDGSVYFSVRRLESYGQLSGRQLDELQAGARVEVDDHKEDPLDFALWKAAKPGEPQWPSPWGSGRPGWHIECSVMSTQYLGRSFDIHGGGMDLIFPHHENEVAQAAAAGHEEFARYWLHNGFVNLNQEKMAKSTGNFFTLREIFRHADPEAVRLFLLTVQYRHPINFNVAPDGGGAARFPDLEEAEQRLAYYYETMLRLEEVLAGAKDPGDGEVLDEAERAGADFKAAMDDDFNTAAALAPISELFRLANRLIEQPKSAPKAVRRRTLHRIRRDAISLGDVLGLWRRDPAAFLTRRRETLARRAGIDPAWIEMQVQERTAARERKDFGAADALRDELAERGVELMDGPRGTRWRVKAQSSERSSER